jgi:hypothetical protein
MSESPETTGTFRNGHVELDSTVGWAEGLRVAIVPLKLFAPQGSNGGGDGSWGMDEAEYEDTSEFRARLIAQMDAFEPLELTPEEEAEWEAASQWRKEHSIAAIRKQMGL